jgi:hypothetical protein
MLGWGNLLHSFLLWIFIFSISCRFVWGLGSYPWNDIFKRVPQYLKRNFNNIATH